MTTTPGVSVAIVGDAFADLFCFLDSDLPRAGGDARLVRPITAVAGGSGLNTATHLVACSGHLYADETDAGGGEGSSTRSANVSLHTAINEDDDHGKMLREHADRYGFALVNCRRQMTCDGSAATGHCAVIVAGGERSFMTHLGVVGMFETAHVNVDEIMALHGPQHHHLHVHVAGYFNIPGFWGGRLKHLLGEIRRMRGGPITVSLLPQHDATEEWDGGILELLPCVDILFVNELEAWSLVRSGTSGARDPANEPSAAGVKVDDEGEDEYAESRIEQISAYFNTSCPSTCIVVTLGSKGAVALRGGEVLCRQTAPMVVDEPVDPTGAGDSFIAGFLFGVFSAKTRGGEVGFGIDLSCRDSLSRGLFYGSILGSSCVLRPGASVPASREEIDTMIDESKRSAQR